MIAIARVDDVRLVSDGAGGWMDVPDLKTPGEIRWKADAIPGQNATMISFETETTEVTTLWHGPHDINGQTYYIVDAPRRVLKRLRNQLGQQRVTPLIKALRARPGLRAWAKAQGFKVVRNSRNKPITILPPLVICGNSPRDLDGDDIETAEELPDLETIS